GQLMSHIRFPWTVSWLQMLLSSRSILGGVRLSQDGFQGGRGVLANRLRQLPGAEYPAADAAGSPARLALPPPLFLAIVRPPRASGRMPPARGRVRLLPQSLRGFALMDERRR